MNPAPHHLYFLADIHLSVNTPEITTAFLAALRQMSATQPDALYILGDLFDAWLGDDLADAFALDIAANLAALPCPVYFQHGNRDFLLGKTFAEKAGLRLLPERHMLDIDGKRILLEHGDLLCIHDRSYLRLRAILRNRLIQALYRRLPTALKRRIARTLRSKSKIAGTLKDPAITDADNAEVGRILDDYHADILIHGHTHRPAQHEHHGKIRYVLGDWSGIGGIGLIYQQGQWRLAQL